MMDLKLYEISEQLRAAVEADDFDIEAINQLSMALEKKAGGILAINSEMQAHIDACKTEETRLAARRKVMENKQAALKNYLKQNMEAADIAKIDLGTRLVSIKKTPPAVKVINEADIPAEFFTIIPESKQLDKKRLKEAITGGRKINGAALTSGTTLLIR